MREEIQERSSTIGQNPASSPCDDRCKTLLERKLPVVTDVDDTGGAIVRQSNIDTLLAVLSRRSERLVACQGTRERLRPTLKRFVCSIVTYFNDRRLLDDVQLSNIMAALVTADDHDRARHGVVDYSTFIRALNPSDPDSGDYFIVGRAGKMSDAECPLEELEGNQAELSRISRTQLHMFRAFHLSRSMDTARAAPRIPVDDFLRLVPGEVKGDPVLEEAFMDVCFSDGAWELYQFRQAA